MGFNKTCNQLFRRYYWPNAKQQIKDFIKSCPKCQLLKGRTLRVKQQGFRVTDLWDTLQIDFTGPVRASKRGNRYILFCLDLSSRYPFAFPLRSPTAESTARCLIGGVFSYIGLPRQLSSDNDRVFTGKFLSTLWSIIGLKSRTGVIYHPQSQGATERGIGTLKSALISLVDLESSDWDDQLPLALWAMRATANGSTATSPFNYVCGQEMRMPADASIIEAQPLMATDPKLRKSAAQIEQWRSHLLDVRRRANAFSHAASDSRALRDNPSESEELQVGDKVLFKPHYGATGFKQRMTHKYEGVYEVVERV
ncbi:hypothetical protein FOL46_003459, partial [Perkinsus olseni]